MAQPVLIRRAGRKQAWLRAAARSTMTTALLLAIPATSPAQEVINNVQLNQGAIQSTQSMDVVENDGLTQASGQATGNQMQGGNENVDAVLTSSQVSKGNVSAQVDINGVNTGAEDLSLGTPLAASTQAVGNYSGFVTTAGHLSANTTQDSTATAVTATTAISAPNNAIYDSGQGDASTEVNDTSYQVTQGRLDSTIVQTSTTNSNANTSATVHYSPSDNLYTAEATNNYYGALSNDQGSQQHDVAQVDAGNTQSRAELYGGNMWNSAVSGTAFGNNANMVNTGGSLVVANNQTQSGDVMAQGYLSADQYGTANASASGIGNSVTTGDNDIYVRLDNIQMSSGGVEVQATFVGNSGYDGYVTADAVGNQAIAYACAECKGDLGVNNNQTNSSDVSATSTASVNMGRSIVSTAHATGNSAMFYVSGSH
ncbi:MAG: holdfast anchor protein HfaD [Asticcacaulis sp.]